MKNFLLSKITNYPFELFGFQHIILLLITLLLFILIFKFRREIPLINEKKLFYIRILMGVIILLNMFIYRFSYMYYNVYDIKVHLSLYLCHIVNYFFVNALIINYKGLYKTIYILSWIGGIWGVFLPQINEGFDCFIFYSIFISHNLLMVFTTFMARVNEIDFSFNEGIKSFFLAIIIVLVTYVINYDFGTHYNEPNYDFLINFNVLIRYFVLLLSGFIGFICSYVVNKLYSK